MGYEVFERKVQRATVPTVSLVKQGRIVLSKSTAEMFAKHGTNLAFLLWDRQNRRIGIRPCFKKDDRRAYLVSLGNGRATAGANINAKTFLDHTGVDYSHTRAYAVHWNDEDQILEVDLPDDAFPNAKVAQPTLVEVPTQLRSA